MRIGPTLRGFSREPRLIARCAANANHVADGGEPFKVSISDTNMSHSVPVNDEEVGTKKGSTRVCTYGLAFPTLMHEDTTHRSRCRETATSESPRLSTMVNTTACWRVYEGRCMCELSANVKLMGSSTVSAFAPWRCRFFARPMMLWGQGRLDNPATEHVPKSGRKILTHQKSIIVTRFPVPLWLGSHSVTTYPRSQSSPYPVCSV